MLPEKGSGNEADSGEEFPDGQSGRCCLQPRKVFCGELFSARTDRNIIPEAAEEELDFREEKPISLEKRTSRTRSRASGE
ncbi:MAG: hypothetical protein DMG41_18010 [Acidobacteria bacterium]|nr:MAG: hypothetical protein AUH13_26670 [Acidobacteria bacterium 13_2_20CM_58_27]PYT86807.1 MAG: hypothetical protein DMG41_18010 [Acidobacteriota bacterium]